MTEPTIICPNCRTAIKLTESLAAPLITSTRQQFEAQLAQKDNDMYRDLQGIAGKSLQEIEGLSLQAIESDANTQKVLTQE